MHGSRIEENETTSPPKLLCKVIRKNDSDEYMGQSGVIIKPKTQWITSVWAAQVRTCEADWDF